MHRADSVRCVGGIVFDADGRLLLVRRAHDPHRGRWSLPGGRVRPGETDAEALVRELREETGLHVTPVTLRGTVPLGRYLISDYTCTVSGGRLCAGDDADDIGWVNSAQFSALATRDALTPGLAETLRTWDALPR
ncbi:NUDIX domain-containing protein [Saccharomonospora piscinae]|uniref:NUDIX hydrolase n=1 Tax=Saccharomonospora piscinae TaxID=687388 RepID=UPI001106B2A5|nr:NUDIX domain-containing protein [Saccharomonospora piscinae]TLW89670.1 NUDIX domain-containing protein [Saccharomonospora piscinae]